MDCLQLSQPSDSHGSTLHWANGHIFPPSRESAQPTNRASRWPQSIRPPDDCGPPQSWPRSPSARRVSWGGLCTQQAQRGLHPAPVAKCECPAVHVVSTATSSCQHMRITSADDRSTSPTSPETVLPTDTPMPMANGSGSAILAHQDPSSTSERPLCSQPPSTASEGTETRSC